MANPKIKDSQKVKLTFCSLTIDHLGEVKSYSSSKEHLGDKPKNGLVEYFIESTYLGGQHKSVQSIVKFKMVRGIFPSPMSYRQSWCSCFGGGKGVYVMDKNV